MSTDKDQHEPREEIAARADTAPEPLEASPRGNTHSEPDEASVPGTMPPPLKP